MSRWNLCEFREPVCCPCGLIRGLYDHITRGTTRSMFETLLKRQWDLERYRSAPYADERERFLLNLQERGYARDRLQGLNRLPLSVAQNVRLDGVEKFSVSQLSATARQWIQNESDRGGSEKSRRCRELDFLFGKRTPAPSGISRAQPLAFLLSSRASCLRSARSRRSSLR
jgi:hypothetical protein